MSLEVVIGRGARHVLPAVRQAQDSDMECEGGASTSAADRLRVLFVQETKNNLGSPGRRPHMWYLSAQVDPVEREAVADKVRRKTATAQKRQRVLEHAGVAVICEAVSATAVRDVRPRGGRIMTARIAAQRE